MRTKSLSIAAALTFSAAFALSGCKSSTPPPAAPAQGLNSDGSVSQSAPPPSSSPTPATAPAAAPGVAAPAQASTAAVQGPPPAPAVVEAPPPPPAPVRLTAPAGTPVAVTITEQLSASHNNVGDGFTGVLAAPVKSSGGGTIFARGARVSGTVVAAKGRGRFKGSGALGIEVTEISGTPVHVSSYEKEQGGKGKRSAGFIGGGAGGGALIGGLAGGGKGALLGGLIGAGAGTAGAAFTGNKDIVIPSESTVTFHLTSPVTITIRPR
jgi:hypothetical protein